jgi:hypothetical protein
MAITRIGPNQSINLASNITGTLPTGNGGTGATSFNPASFVKINKSTISSGTAQIDFNGLFSSTYDKYFVCANNVQISSNAALQLYVIIGGSAVSADYSTSSQAYDASGTSRSYGNTGLSRIAINSAANYAGTTYRHSLQFYIANPLATNQWKTINGIYGGWTDQAANTVEVGNFSGAYRGATTALSGIRIATSNSATFEAGDVTLYGVL